MTDRNETVLPEDAPLIAVIQAAEIEVEIWKRESCRCDDEAKTKCEHCGLGYMDWAAVDTLWKFSRLRGMICPNCFARALLRAVGAEQAKHEVTDHQIELARAALPIGLNLATFQIRAILEAANG